MVKALILGGTGFIGRHLVKYLVDNNFCKRIKAVDKQFPITAYFSKEIEEAFKNPIVKFMQGNLANLTSIRNCFRDEEDPDHVWDVVFNVSAETKYGQPKEIYKEKIVDVTKKCSQIAHELGVKKWIEVSNAQVYKSGKTESNEKAEIKPWTKLAEAQYQAEKELEKVGIPYVVMRPTVVYGPGDVMGISPRIICAAVYKEIKEEMKMLWDDSLFINTINVYDVAAAAWFLYEKGISNEIYNLTDDTKTTQGKIAAHLEKLFGIKISFIGNIKSTLATKVSFKSLSEEINEKHLGPWANLCKEHKIFSTPLTPYIDKELLYKNSLSIKCDKIKESGFKLQYPILTEELIKSQIDYYANLSLFPNFWG